MKQVYQKQCAENIQQKQDQNNDFSAEVTQKERKVLTIKEISHNDF